MGCMPLPSRRRWSRQAMLTPEAEYGYFPSPAVLPEPSNAAGVEQRESEETRRYSYSSQPNPEAAMTTIPIRPSASTRTSASTIKSRFSLRSTTSTRSTTSVTSSLTRSASRATKRTSQFLADTYRAGGPDPIDVDREGRGRPKSTLDPWSEETGGIFML